MTTASTGSRGGFAARLRPFWPVIPLVAIAAVISFCTVGVQVARVEGQAMSPTLRDQDRLVVNLLVYRLREPRRDEIVMLLYPVDPSKKFVKRVIAVEGDRVRVTGGTVYVNDVASADPYVVPEARSRDNWGPAIVPAGYYFVMGDRRNNSSDSRHWGYVPRNYILGRVQARWWPVVDARAY